MWLALAAGAAAVVAAPTPPAAPQKQTLANPASVACAKGGGTLTIVTAADGGQIGICTRKDGTQCEEWALFRDQICVLPPGLEGQLTPRK